MDKPLFRHWSHFAYDLKKRRGRPNGSEGVEKLPSIIFYEGTGRFPCLRQAGEPSERPHLICGISSGRLKEMGLYMVKEFCLNFYFIGWALKLLESTCPFF